MNGFFAGGMAEGMLESRKMGLAERTNEQDVGLRTRALDINEKQFGAELARKENTRLDEHIANTMNIVSETIKAGLEGGKDPNALAAAVQPLVQSAQQIAMKAGRNPDALAAQVQAQLFQPTPVGRAAVAGEAAATQAVSQDTAERKLLLQQQPATPGQPEPELQRRYKSAAEKTNAENALRDDYSKQAKDFVTMRDAKQRIDSLEKTGAGDMALIFQYMKLLDPSSTVREGEYATAANAAGVPSTLQAIYNRVVGGGQLGDDGRKQILSQANRFYNTAALQHDKLTTDFANKAKRQGLNANNVIIDFAPATAARPDPLNIR